jgi:rhodanese-related sulfurtransferase
MFLKQYYLGCLAHASYLIADEASASAIVVDPQRDIQQYLADAVGLGGRIAVHCAGGYRSSIGVSILNQHGITNVIELAGGITAWEAAKLKVVSN